MRKLYFLFLIGSWQLSAQTLDPTFNANHSGPYKEYIGHYGIVTDDGKLTTMNWQEFLITKYNTDGSRDTGSAFSSPTMYVEQMRQGPGGKIMVYSYYLDSDTPIRILNANGSVNSTFTCPYFVGEYIQEILWQPNGKFIVMGEFTEVNGYERNNIVRLNSDGSVDTTFNPGNGAVGGAVNCATLQPDGKYLIGGRFYQFNGVSRKRITRINADGSNDATFHSYNGGTEGFETTVNKIVIQPDGKYLVSGDRFRNGSTYPTRMMTRLLSTGMRDTSFNCPQEVTYGPNDFVLLPDGTILVDAWGNLVKLNSNGSSATGFSYSNAGFDVHPASSIIPLPDGKFLYNADYLSTTGVTRDNIHRVNADGSVDLTFNPQQSVNDDADNMVVLNSGKILLTGEFTAYNDTGCRPVIRLSADGELDPEFTLGANVNASDGTFVIREQADGKILIGSPFYASNMGYISAGNNSDLIRLNENGSHDASFLYNTSNGSIIDFQVLDNGKILVLGLGGIFSSGGKKVIRLNADGTVDTTFPNLVYPDYRSLIKFADGSLFIIAKGTGSWRFFKLTPDGLADSSFSNGNVDAGNIQRQSDGKYIISYGSSDRNMRRINADGSPDATFPVVPVAGYSWTEPNPIFVNSNGEVITYSNESDEMSMYSPDGAFQQSFGGSMAFTWAQQGCDRLLKSISAGNSPEFEDIVRYTINPSSVSAPTGDSSQVFNTGQTLVDLEVTGQAIQWFAEQTECGQNVAQKMIDDEPLPFNTPLVNGTTYYASQTVGGVESTYRLPVTVTQSLGVLGQQAAHFRLFPNPTKTFVTLSGDAAVKKIEIYNIMGQHLKTLESDGENATIDVSGYDPGVYFLRVSGNGITETLRFIKE